MNYNPDPAMDDQQEDTSTMHEKLRVGCRCEEKISGVPVKYAASKFKALSKRDGVQYYKYKLNVRHGRLFRKDNGTFYILIPPETRDEPGILLLPRVRVYANGQSVWGINHIGTSKYIYQWWFADEKTPKLPRLVTV